ncbi:hypothetical protein QMG83_15265 [Salinibacterium sp. G-O1]|uniref:LPD29 domain-containing protein n=1 Tax=Salinibacterium sp. G-O1 TaxID=3046208 RepID=UPI0024BB804C|nr:LPD29 domain-containing protein [Salinibacterium sp. G-O1]MDJ0336587.1 hypothetical protein [Salinibacterium sp. G-O1]
MTDYISTKDTATLVRVALKSAFPGVKFSVRMSTGTASAWMRVRWSDGPTTRDVDAITARYEGRKFNSMTDGYDDAGSVLIAGEGNDMPREIRYCCDGINTQRDYTPAGFAVAQKIISTDSDHKDLTIFSPEGEKIAGAIMPDSIHANGHYHDYIYSPEDLARVILHHVNLCTVTTASNERKAKQ